jgi:hypothetical protein
MSIPCAEADEACAMVKAVDIETITLDVHLWSADCFLLAEVLLF